MNSESVAIDQHSLRQKPSKNIPPLPAPFQSVPNCSSNNNNNNKEISNSTSSNTTVNANATSTSSSSNAVTPSTRSNHRTPSAASPTTAGGTTGFPVVRTSNNKKTTVTSSAPHHNHHRIHHSRSKSGRMMAVPPQQNEDKKNSGASSSSPSKISTPSSSTSPQIAKNGNNFPSNPSSNNLQQISSGQFFSGAEPPLIASSAVAFVSSPTQVITSTMAVVNVRDDPKTRKRNETSYLASIRPNLKKKKQEQVAANSDIIDQQENLHQDQSKNNLKHHHHHHHHRYPIHHHHHHHHQSDDDDDEVDAEKNSQLHKQDDEDDKQRTQLQSNNNNNNNNNNPKNNNVNINNTKTSIAEKRKMMADFLNNNNTAPIVPMPMKVSRSYFKQLNTSAEVAQVVRGVGVQNFFRTKAKIEYEDQLSSNDERLGDDSSTSSENSMSTISSDTHSSQAENDHDENNNNKDGVNNNNNNDPNNISNQNNMNSGNLTMMNQRKNAFEVLDMLADGKSHSIDDYIQVIDTAIEDLTMFGANDGGVLAHSHHHHHQLNDDKIKNGALQAINNNNPNGLNPNNNSNNKLNIVLPMKMYTHKTARIPCAMVTVSARLGGLTAYHQHQQQQQRQNYLLMNNKKGKKIFGAQFSALGGGAGDGMSGFDAAEELLFRMTGGKGRNDAHALHLGNITMLDDDDDEDDAFFANRKDNTLLDEAEIKLRRAQRFVRRKVQLASRSMAEMKSSVTSTLDKFGLLGNVEKMARNRLDGVGENSDDDEPEIYSGFDIQPRAVKAPNAYYLDHPAMMGVRRRKIVSTASFRSSIIAFAGKQETAQDLDRQFVLRHPFCKPLNLKLSEIRTIKDTMLQLALKDGLIDVATVAYAVCYIERLILRRCVNDRSLFLVAATCLLIACKFNEGALFESMRKRIKYVKQRCREFLNVTGEEMIAAEPHVLVALKFELHVHDSYVKRHWVRLLGSANLLPAQYLAMEEKNKKKEKK